MSDPGDLPLYVEVAGPGWRASLEVQPPQDLRPRYVQFSVPWTGHDLTRGIVAEVRYTRATNMLQDGWRHWHVKIYGCTTDEDCVALRSFLRRQAIDIQAANTALDGPARIPIDPPWAVVPVQIVRGDGEPENYGGTRTELGAPPRPPVRWQDRYPEWFADSEEVAARTIIAISPTIETITWEKVCRTPAVHHLESFEAMAAGLDTLHRKNVVHSDIKPANVCRYWDGENYGYVLIDADAATRTKPEPVTLRFTPPYVHSGVLAWKERDNPNEAISATTLLAHDRFCFAVLVLSALAGVDWVRAVLLTPDDPETSHLRPVDQYEVVLTRLEKAWQARSKEDFAFIKALAEPFKPAVLLDNWSAVEWIGRIRRSRLAKPDLEQMRLLNTYRGELSATRKQLRQERPDKSVLADRAVNVIHARAAKLAWREARRWLYGSAFGLTMMALLIAASAVFKGK